MAEAFKEAGKVRDCDSSGSEHSPETMMDLSDLVNSFIENGNGVGNGDFDVDVDEDEFSLDGIDDDMEEMESLKRLVRVENGDHRRRKLIDNVEKARRDVVKDELITPQSLGFKRKLMARLRDQGLDAGKIPRCLFVKYIFRNGVCCHISRFYHLSFIMNNIIINFIWVSYIIQYKTTYGLYDMLVVLDSVLVC